MLSDWSRERWAATAGAILSTIALPIAIDQGYFRHSVYALPLLGLVATLLYVLLFATSKTCTSLFNNFATSFGHKQEAFGLLIPEGALLIIVGLLVLSFWISVRASAKHVAVLEKSEHQTGITPQPQQVVIPQSPSLENSDHLKQSSSLTKSNNPKSPMPEVFFLWKSGQIELHNSGKGNIYIQTFSYGEHARVDTTSDAPRVITPGTFYYLFTDDLEKKLREKLGENGDILLPCRWYISTADHQKYTVNCKLFATTKSGSLQINTQNLGVVAGWVTTPLPRPQ